MVVAPLVQSGCSEHVKSSETALHDAGSVADHHTAAPVLLDGGVDSDPGLDEVCSAGTLSEAGAEPVQGLASQLALGNEHSCARFEGEVWCWGNNRNGELGDGNTIARGHPVRVQQLSAVSGVYSGDGFEICGGTRGSHTCALLLANGNVSCWGANVEGKASMEDAKPTLLPMLIPALSNVVQLGVGGYGSCAVLGDGTMRCWGEVLGCDNDGGVDGFLEVQGLGHATKVVVGWGFGCALLSDGGVSCWGSNFQGELGDGTKKGRPTAAPALIPGGKAAIDVTTGGAHVCALLADLTVACWGSGMLGDGQVQVHWVPFVVPGLSGVAQVSAGGGHTCAVLGDGTLWCWGSNSSGQLGIGHDGGSRLEPVLVPGLSNVVEVAAGPFRHTCARLADGTVWCWGLNDAGQIGDGTTVTRTLPARVSP
ncbi:MAG: hypothetical protein HY898_10935 [Deltaproteobacteria bacterium]|nr:hypothetical protein [Deltaproteobacteria bacterium]